MQGEELQPEVGIVQPKRSSLCQSLWVLLSITQRAHLRRAAGNGGTNGVSEQRSYLGGDREIG